MQIVELPVPTTLDEPAATDFVATVAVRNEVQNLIFGAEAGTFSAEELLPNWTDPYSPKRLFAGRVGGRTVARAVYETAVNGSPDVAFLQIEVLPEFRGRGIGTALLDAMIAAAREEGRTTVQAYAGAAEKAGGRLTAATGHGSVPVDDPGVRFLQRHGWTLEQVERGSRLPLPVADLDARVAAAQEASGPDYRVHTWVDCAPTHWVPDLAELGTGMGTDAPSAELEAEDVWTPERWIEDEERNEGSPRTLLVAAVEHVPSGRIVGFTELSAPAELDRAVSQEDTIVARDHRGHRLGMLLKVANLAHLQQQRPGHPAVTTFNAEENRHMLAVNEAVGFVPFVTEGAWKTTLAR